MSASSPRNGRNVQDDLEWLNDAPLYIDAESVASYYDAVVNPEHDVESTTLSLTESKLKNIEGKMGASATADVDPSAFLGGLLKPFTNVFKFGGEVRGDIGGKTESSNEKGHVITLVPITTPHRQLKQLTLFYLASYPDRIALARPSDSQWRDEVAIRDVPRMLVYLDLPGQAEAKEWAVPATKLIPTAAEFADGNVVTLFDLQKSRDGRESAPPYPDDANMSIEELRSARRSYWAWFESHYSATRSMGIVEKAASQHGRIRWIDFRLPITESGETLHLHITPDENYDTGVFAYNFIKRGFKHGLRLIGTVRSEPDMTVLAVYDK